MFTTSNLVDSDWQVLPRSGEFDGSDAEHWEARRADACIRLVVQRAADTRPETIRGRFAMALLEAVCLARPAVFSLGTFSGHDIESAVRESAVRLGEGPARMAYSSEGLAHPAYSNQAPEDPGQSQIAFAIGAVVSAPRVSAADIRRVRAIAETYGASLGWGIIGDDGNADLHVPPLEFSRRAQRPARTAARPEVGNPFSDLGQWIIKLLYKRTVSLPDQLLTGPVHWPATYEGFAATAGVAIKTVWQLTKILDTQGFLASSGDAQLLARLPELCDRWRGATRVRAQPVSCRWLIPAGERQLHDALRDIAVVEPYQDGTRIQWRNQARRACLAGISACRSLGLAITPERIPELYVESMAGLHSLGLTPAGAGDKPDVLAHVARWPEATFRAAVVQDGIPCTDILQTWLDVVDQPARGREQARRLEKTLFGNQR